MSIPVTASTYEWTPNCLSEVEGAPVFVFRHATRRDKHEHDPMKRRARLFLHGPQKLRDVTVSELRKLFNSDGMEQNVTRLEAYWAAVDEFRSASSAYMRLTQEILRDADGDETVELPDPPVLEFDAEESDKLDAIVEEVRRYSDELAALESDNERFAIMYPRLLLRWLLVSTSLDIELPRQNGLIGDETAERVIELLDNFAVEHGVNRNVAASELLVEAQAAFYLRGDEEKNSSAPRSGSTPRKSSTRGASKSRASAKSKTRASTAKASG